MDSTIAAALISAMASLLVALLGHAGARTHNAAPSPMPVTGHLPRNRLIWMITAGLTFAWTVYAAFFLHWDLAGMSLLLIPVVVWALAVAFPISPWNAAAISLLLFPFAFMAEPIGKWRRGISSQNHFEAGVLAICVAAGFGTALIAAALCWWRGRAISRKALPDALPSAFPGQPPSVSTPLARELADLAELHRTGVLTDEEFARTKAKLISR